MNKQTLLFGVLVSCTINCFAEVTSTWNPTQSPYNWGSGHLTNNWTNGIPLTSGDVAIFSGAGSIFPEINADFTLQQLQLLNSTNDLWQFTTDGATVMSFASNPNINQIECMGSVSVATSFETTGNTIRIADPSKTSYISDYGVSFFAADGSTNRGLLQGTGTVHVGESTVLHYNPTSMDTDFTNNYQFSGTINLDEDLAVWVIQTASGPFVGQITGSNPNTLIEPLTSFTLHNSHTFSGMMLMSNGLTLTLGTSGGSLPNANLFFNDSTGGVLALTSDAAVGGLFSEEQAVTLNEINLGTSTLTINQNSESVNFSDTFEGTNTYWGRISGSGGIIKAGTSPLELKGTNTYTGATQVTAGELKVNSSIATSSLLTIGTSGTVTGTGTLPATTNNGTLNPGNSVGTHIIEGNYIQSSTGNLIVEISSVPVASKLEISGSATLAGTLTVDLQKGLYPLGTSVTFLTSEGIRSGTFSTVVDSLNTTFVPVYGLYDVKLVCSQHHVNPPVVTNAISGINATSVANYLIEDLANSTFNQEIVNQVNKVLNHSFTDEQYLDALIAVSPLAVAGINKVHAQNIERHARSVDETFISRARSITNVQQNIEASNLHQYVSSKEEGAAKYSTPKSQRREEKLTTKKTGFASVYGEYETSVFLEPYVIIYDQDQIQGNITNLGQIPFQTYTFGAGGGVELVFDENFVFETGAGYSYSHLDWRDDFGSAYWNTVYLAPFLGWFDQDTFINVMVLGGFNFTQVSRAIPVEGIDQVAKGKFTNYDLLVRLNAGVREAVCVRETSTDWLQGEATVNYLNIFTPSYTETGAGSLNLKYKSNTQMIIQPRVIAKWIHEVVYSKGIVAPVIKLGWMGTFPINKQTLSTKLALSPTASYFLIQGYDMTNQMIAGAELFYKSPRQFKITSGFDTYFFDKSMVFDFGVKMEWLF